MDQSHSVIPLRSTKAREFYDEILIPTDFLFFVSISAMVAAQWLGLRLQFLGVAMVTAVAFIAVLEHHFSTVDPGDVTLFSYCMYVLNPEGFCGNWMYYVRFLSI